MPNECPHCGKALDGNATECIRLPSDLLLLRRNLYNRMATYVAELKDVSSREFPGWVSDTIYEYVFEQGGSVCEPKGEPFFIGPDDIENAFNDDIDRWVRVFRQHAVKPLKQRPQVRLAARLRFIWLACEIDKRKLK